MWLLNFTVSFFGGLAMFLYGVRTCSDGVQKFAAQRLKVVLRSLGTKSFMPTLLGILLTVAFQSSAASTVLLIEFVSIDLVNFATALEFALASAVGTSVTIQLIAFRMFSVALVAIFVGVIFHLFVRSYRLKYLGQILIGFGLLFVGMNFMSTGSDHIRNMPSVLSVLVTLGKSPLAAIIVGIVSAAIFQGPAVFAIMMSLASKGLLTLTAFVPLVIGAHIGGTLTTLVAGLITQDADGRRVAIANTGYKVAAAVLVYPFLQLFERLVQLTSGDVQRQIANTHLLFAILMVVIFLPFNGLIGKLLMKVVSGTKRLQDSRKFVYISEKSLEIPEIALQEVQFEEVRLGNLIVKEMLQKIPLLFTAENSIGVEEFVKADTDVGWFYHNIFRFLLRLSEQSLCDDHLEQVFAYQFIIKELEYLGDIHITLVHKVKKLQEDNELQVPRIWELLKDYYGLVFDNFCLLLNALEEWNADAAGKVIQRHPEIVRLERQLQYDVLMRGAKSDNSDVEDQLKHLNIDIINSLYEIDEHGVNIAQVIAGVI